MTKEAAEIELAKKQKDSSGRWFCPLINNFCFGTSPDPNGFPCVCYEPFRIMPSEPPFNEKTGEDIPGYDDYRVENDYCRHADFNHGRTR